MFALEPWQWSLAAFGAFSIGMAKTGFGGLGMIGILVMAWLLPPRDSTGVILPMLIMADLFGVHAFQRHTQWSHVLRLLPAAVVGVVAGWWFMGQMDNASFGRVIGAVLLVMSGLGLWRVLKRTEVVLVVPRWFGPIMGFVAGVATMLANAAGAVVTLYLLVCRLPKYEFVGTAAWFFFIVNLFKIPFSASLGLVTWETLGFNLMLFPAIALGAFSGKRLIAKLPQRLFEGLMLVFTILGAIKLLFWP